MKKLLMIAALMVATVSANAQFEPGTFSIQPKIGGVAAWLSNMPNLKEISIGGKQVTLDKTPVGGFVIGGEAEYQLTNMFSVAAGLNYSLQGSAWEDFELKYGNDKTELKDSKIELGYLTVPVVVNAYLFKGFAIKTGVQFGFLTNANIKSTLSKYVDATKTTTSTTEDESFKDDCKKMDISIPIGVSYQFNIPIVIDCRYNLGLTKVNKENIPGQKDFKNNVVQLTVGYKFKL